MVRAAWVLVLLMGATNAFASDNRGWGYLVDKLIADGIDPPRVRRAFRDPRMGAFDGLEFSPNRPREATSRYRQFKKPATVAQARQCRARFRQEFEAAARGTAVPPSLLAALLFVETSCGRNTGSSVVLHRLARLAMANEPENLQRNLWAWAESDGSIDPDVDRRLRERARYLENTFYPEVRATFVVAEHMGIDPLELRGSPSGAFGHPQFLPTSYLRFGTDGDGDGVVSLYSTADAAASAARYLTAHGWRSGLSRSGRRDVIWNYNRSDAYVDTVLGLAASIDAPAPAPSRSRKSASRKRAGASKKRGG